VPFQRPTLQEISQRVQADFVRIYNDGKPLKVRSIPYVLSQVIAGTSHMLHGHLDYIAKQIFPDTCDTESLVRMALARGMTRKPATRASGMVLFEGTVGTVVPVGTQLTREDGVLFETQNPGEITDVGCEIQTQCKQEGRIGNTSLGTALTLANPTPGVTQATSKLIQNGFALETHEALLARLLMRLRRPIRGGTKQDFIQWTLEVPGVKNAWVFSHIPHPGHLTILCITNNVEAPLPNEAMLAQVRAHLEESKPILAQVQVSACTSHPIELTIRLDSSDDALKSRIENSLKHLLFEEATPNGRILHAHILGSITRHLRGEDFTLLAPSADVQAYDRSLCTYGGVSWV
jgi:uncharacterized phage protein gp47/JayE